MGSWIFTVLQQIGQKQCLCSSPLLELNSTLFISPHLLAPPLQLTSRGKWKFPVIPGALQETLLLLLLTGSRQSLYLLSLVWRPLGPLLYKLVHTWTVDWNKSCFRLVSDFLCHEAMNLTEKMLTINSCRLLICITWYISLIGQWWLSYMIHLFT